MSTASLSIFFKGKDFALAEFLKSGVNPVESVNYDTFLDSKLRKKKKEPTLRRDVKLQYPFNH